MLKYILAAVFTLVACVSFQAPAEAGFADDWLANSTTSSPSYFEGQKRGYLSAGGFSARWKTSNDYLVSVTPPRVKAGCGGIDAFWGGMTFMKPQYLVQKLENIVQNSPAVAVDLALNVLCEPCKNAMETMERASNALNSIQLDDCKATQALVAKGAEELGSQNGELNNIVTNFEVSTNVAQGYKDVQDSLAANGNKPDPNDVKNSVADCSDELKALFITNAETNGTSSLLTNIAGRLNMPVTYAQLLAGMVGDIGINFDSASGFTVFNIPFCEQNRTLNVDGLLSDAPYLRDFTNPTGQCTQATDSNANLSSYVSTKLVSIANKMNTQADLTADESAFLNYCNGVTYDALKVGVETGTSDDVQDVLSRIVAKDITRHMLTDLYSKGEAMLAKAKEVAVKNQQSTSGTPARCQVTMFDGTDKKIEKMRERIAQLRNELNQGYQKELEQMTTFTAYIRDHQYAAEQFENEVAKRFGLAAGHKGTKM